MDDDVGHVLDRDASATSDVDGGATSVDGLEAVDDELVFEGYYHVGGEYDPEGDCLDDGVAECSGLGVDRVIVKVNDQVKCASFSSAGAGAKPHPTIR